MTGEPNEAELQAQKRFLLSQLDCNCYDCEDKFSADLDKYVHILAEKIRAAVDSEGIFGTDAADLIDPEVTT